ncbi:MAG: tetratricopeptide repeat protein [Bacteroidales bacterium]|nr:tetratricopeptide repeat protein [Bacteroidales bacterium]MBD5247800.1 tetratricopeptide repeat protein [Barnesiella sp.]
MTSLPNIQQLIDQNRFAEANDEINLYISENAHDDEAFFMRGKLWWRQQNYSAAVTDFETAVAINPDSDARHALELARDVFDFYNPDLLNP